jgi:hypothetical protein
MTVKHIIPQLHKMVSAYEEFSTATDESRDVNNISQRLSFIPGVNSENYRLCTAGICMGLLRARMFMKKFGRKSDNRRGQENVRIYSRARWENRQTEWRCGLYKADGFKIYYSTKTPRKSLSNWHVLWTQ